MHWNTSLKRWKEARSNSRYCRKKFDYKVAICLRLVAQTYKKRPNIKIEVNLETQNGIWMSRETWFSKLMIGDKGVFLRSCRFWFEWSFMTALWTWHQLGWRFHVAEMNQSFLEKCWQGLNPPLPRDENTWLRRGNSAAAYCYIYWMLQCSWAEISWSIYVIKSNCKLPWSDIKDKLASSTTIYLIFKNILVSARSFWTKAVWNTSQKWPHQYEKLNTACAEMAKRLQQNVRLPIQFGPNLYPIGTTGKFEFKLR